MRCVKGCRWVGSALVGVPDIGVCGFMKAGVDACEGLFKKFPAAGIAAFALFEGPACVGEFFAGDDKFARVVGQAAHCGRWHGKVFIDLGLQHALNEGVWLKAHIGGELGEFGEVSVGEIDAQGVGFVDHSRVSCRGRIIGFAWPVLTGWDGAV